MHVHAGHVLFDRKGDVEGGGASRLLGPLRADDDEELVAALVQVYDGANAAAHLDRLKTSARIAGRPPNSSWPPESRPRNEGN
ncbi:hypothetical protein [Nonomuraea aridisoli]|uniref:hypothetical protein n=1 Tax=Nonomuraea aridisoli TaxID=2070368 RepID=UPI0015E89109|nr:hypothetical protein [Nonomuraea aridisoli]